MPAATSHIYLQQCWTKRTRNTMTFPVNHHQKPITYLCSQLTRVCRSSSIRPLHWPIRLYTRGGHSRTFRSRKPSPPPIQRLFPRPTRKSRRILRICRPPRKVPHLPTPRESTSGILQLHQRSQLRRLRSD